MVKVICGGRARGAKASDWGWDRAGKGRGTGAWFAFPTQNGADVDRKTRDMIARISDNEVPRSPFRGRLSGASAVLSTTDGRWALVSTSMTALVAGAIAWMAVGMMPVN